MTKVREIKGRLSVAFTRLSEERADWDNEQDAAYDDWKAHYGVS